MVLAPSFSRPSIKTTTTPQLSHFAFHPNLSREYYTQHRFSSPMIHLLHISFAALLILHSCISSPTPSPQVFQSCSISATWTRTHRPWQQSIIWIPDPQRHRKTRDKVSDILLLPISLSRSTLVLATNKQTKRAGKKSKRCPCMQTTKPQLLPSNKNPEEERARTWRKFVEEDTQTEKSREGISMHWRYRPEL